MKNDIDLEEQRTRINKMIIDMEHNVEQRSHSKERAKALDEQYQERSKAQDRHWKFQKFIWGLAATIAIITAIGAPVLTEYIKLQSEAIQSEKSQ